MSKRTQIVEVVAQAATMLTCAGAVVAAGFTVNEVVKLHNNSTLVERINEVNGNILTRLMATVSLALAAGLVIPLGIIMILLSLCKMKVECCTKCLAIVDVVVILFAICGYGIAGALGSITAKNWSNQILSTITDSDIVRHIRINIAATAGCSLLACVACAALLLFIIVQYVRFNIYKNQERSNFKYGTYDQLSLKST